jgi:pseudouridine-5'-phosphate glycosidase
MPLVISPEVEEAVRMRLPVVALESTIIAHGFPYPANLEVARELEATVRAGAAIPATIAVLGGRARIGLADDELALLARRGPAIAKAGAADLAVHMAGAGDAATTVSATAVLAARAGIRVFATGGIGGVHRGRSPAPPLAETPQGSLRSADGAHHAFDVSHDLYALATTRIAVVSAGVKAILDLPRTLELLESLGVLVLGLGTAELPAFYSRSSGLALDHRVDDLATVARILRVRWDLGQGGALVCAPIPADAELPAAEIDAAIARALADAEAAGIGGKRLTPYLLARIGELTGGRSVAANRALARHDAEVAARLAAAMV